VQPVGSADNLPSSLKIILSVIAVEVLPTTIETIPQTEPTTVGLVAETTRIPAEMTTACPDCATTAADEARIRSLGRGICHIATVCIVVEILNLNCIVFRSRC